MERTVTRLPDGTAVIRLEGRLNMVSADGLRNGIESLVEEGIARVVVDLAEVSFMDSSGLGALIGGVKAARRAGGDLRIAAPPDQVRLVLRLTTLERILPPHDTVESAVRGG
jgi:anti-sigma B factor antagonist